MGNEIMSGRDLKIELFDEAKHSKIIPTLTKMLHECYKPLAERGMKYLASHQSEEITLRRISKGHGFLAFIGSELVGTISLIEEDPHEPSEWYQKPEVFFFMQFAVKPSHQGLGIGKQLMNHIEKFARERGASEIALDTSEQAQDLISKYKKIGYRFVEYADWSETNYRSVVMSKSLENAI